MKFLIISQRAFSNPNYLLKDLTGHGRFDIIPRVILAVRRDIINIIINNKKDEVYVLLKGGDHGWIYYNDDVDGEDEISIAAIIKDNWPSYFTSGNLDKLLVQINPGRIYFLTEDGYNININENTEYIENNILNNFDFENNFKDEDLVILGAQRDLVEEDLQSMNNFGCEVIKLSLGKEAMLASHGIIFLRQLIHVNTST